MSTLSWIIIFVLVVALVWVVMQLASGKKLWGGVTGAGVFRMKVSDPEYTALLTGKKTVDARLDRPPFDRLKVGDRIVVVRSRPQGDTSEYPGGKYKFPAEIVRVKKYGDIEKLLKAEGIDKVYPGRTHADAVKQFKQYLPEGTTVSDPVIAYELKMVSEDGASKKPKKGMMSQDMYGMSSHDMSSHDMYGMESGYNPYGVQSYSAPRDDDLDITSYFQ